MLDGATVPWSSVRTIATYKLDLLVQDAICLAFEVGDDVWVVASEEERGFDSLRAELARRYPGIPGDWFWVAAMPPFAENYRVLWRAPR
jgi:hypothetical protein